MSGVGGAVCSRTCHRRPPGPVIRHFCRLRPCRHIRQRQEGLQCTSVCSGAGLLAASPDQPARSRTKPSLKPTFIRAPSLQCWTRSSGRVWYATVEGCGGAIGLTEPAFVCRQALLFQDSPSTEWCVHLAGMRMRFVARGFTVVASTCYGALGSLREAGLAA